MYSIFWDLGSGFCWGSLKITWGWFSGCLMGWAIWRRAVAAPFFRLPYAYATSVQRKVSPAHIGTTRASPKAKLSGTRCSRFSSVMVRVFSGCP